MGEASTVSERASYTMRNSIGINRCQVVQQSFCGMQSGLLASVRIVVPAERADAAIELLARSADDDDTFRPISTPPVRNAADIDDSADVSRSVRWCASWKR
jgi:hypothetical protein